MPEEIPVPSSTTLACTLVPYSPANCPCLENRGSTQTLYKLDQGMIGQNSVTFTFNCPPSSNNWTFTLTYEKHGNDYYWHLVVKYNGTIRDDQLLLVSVTNGKFDDFEFDCNLEAPCNTNLKVKFHFTYP